MPEDIHQVFARFERALAADPRNLEARLGMASILGANDYRLDAVQLLFEGCQFHARDSRLRAALAGMLEGFPLDTATPAVRGMLLDLCRDDNIATQALADAVIGLMKNASDEVLVRDPLLHAVLERAIVNDADLERRLTRLRKNVVDPGFARALAWQCFNNEYAWFVAPDEPATPPLYAPGPEQQAQLDEEKEIARRIESVTPIRGGVSRKVRDMYEQNPYPRWLTLQRPQPLPRPAGPPPSIFIAGGGTGQHPIHTALSHPDSEVLVVDLSRASLAYASRMAKKYGATNLTFKQADILELGVWVKNSGRKFDIVESVGVLHHLEDPIAGWRVLTGLLKDGGRMRIGLYSAIARKPLQAARDLVKERGFPGTPEGIRACRQAIIDLPTSHPARSVLESDDFYSASGCRDLIMHVQEHAFTLPELAGAIKQLGLTFTGFAHSPSVNAKFLNQYPNPASLTDLSLWDRFEHRHPEVFRGMYQFYCALA